LRQTVGSDRMQCCANDVSEEPIHRTTLRHTIQTHNLNSYI